MKLKAVAQPLIPQIEIVFLIEETRVKINSFVYQQRVCNAKKLNNCICSLGNCCIFANQFRERLLKHKRVTQL